MLKISVLIVTMNSGEELRRTVNSCLLQKNCNMEIIVKDGLSTDASIECLPLNDRIRIVRKKDDGIYDAMNQAILFATGDIAVYMNCGDVFYSETILCQVAAYIEKDFTTNTIYYGDCYTANRDSFLRYPDVFNDYVCFTKVLCHQATFYPMQMLKKRSFSLDYKIAADYEYYVYAYINGCRMVHIPVVVVSYQGNGASETRINRKKSLIEGNQIRRNCFPASRYIRTWIAAQARGMGIKHFLVTQEWFYPCYKKIAELYYGTKNNKEM